MQACDDGLLAVPKVHSTFVWRAGCSMSYEQPIYIHIVCITNKYVCLMYVYRARARVCNFHTLLRTIVVDVLLCTCAPNAHI